ncbi:hypothetical protein H8356DRAFT_1428233 [Neocallimastix lanati (nom. inval.)]|nr:hypothetical protein H8356DRAFT_1428233 [Neocallimastix sp. JGI-2020a]
MAHDSGTYAIGDTGINEYSVRDIYGYKEIYLTHNSYDCIDRVTGKKYYIEYENEKYIGVQKRNKRMLSSNSSIKSKYTYYNEMVLSNKFKNKHLKTFKIKQLLTTKTLKFDKNNMKKNNDNSTNNGNIILTLTLKLYPLESYGRELQHMLKSTLLDN